MRYIETYGRGTFLEFEIDEEYTCTILRRVRNKKGFTLWVLGKDREVYKIPASRLEFDKGINTTDLITLICEDDNSYRVTFSDEDMPFSSKFRKSMVKQISSHINESKHERYIKNNKIPTSRNNIKKEKNAHSLRKGNFKIFLSGKVQEDFFWK